MKKLQVPLSRASAFNPLSIARALYKKRFLIVSCSILLAAAGIAYVFRLKPVYKAEALILVESQKIPETFVASTVQTSLETRLDSLKEQVLSNERLWNLIESYHLYGDLRQKQTHDELLRHMRNDIGIILERSWSSSRPGAFRVAYETDSPQIAAKVSNRISKFFIDENLNQRSEEAAATSRFMDSQMDDAKRALEEQERRLSEFKVMHSGELPEQAGSLLAFIGQDRAELLGIQESVARTQQNIVVVQGSLGLALENLNTFQARLTSPDQNNVLVAQTVNGSGEQRPLALELEVLRARYQEAHPDVQRLMRELAAQEAARVELQKPASLTSAKAVAAKPRLTDAQEQMLINAKQTVENLQTQLAIAQRELTTLDSRRKQIIQDLEESQSRVAKVPVREQQLAAITRDYDTSKASYQSLLRKKIEADIASNMERWQKAERFVLLNAARAPEKPEKPKRPLLIVCAVIGSLVAAILIAIFLETQSNVVLGDWELPKRIPVFGYVSLAESLDV